MIKNLDMSKNFVEKLKIQFWDAPAEISLASEYILLVLTFCVRFSKLQVSHSRVPRFNFMSSKSRNNVQVVSKLEKQTSVDMYVCKLLISYMIGS
jgi:hypothetical protein